MGSVDKGLKGDHAQHGQDSDRETTNVCYAFVPARSADKDLEDIEEDYAFNSHDSVQETTDVCHALIAVRSADKDLEEIKEDHA